MKKQLPVSYKVDCGRSLQEDILHFHWHHWHLLSACSNLGSIVLQPETQWRIMWGLGFRFSVGEEAVSCLIQTGLWEFAMEILHFHWHHWHLLSACSNLGSIVLQNRKQMENNVRASSSRFAFQEYCKIHSDPPSLMVCWSHFLLTRSIHDVLWQVGRQRRHRHWMSLKLCKKGGAPGWSKDLFWQCWLTSAWMLYLWWVCSTTTFSHAASVIRKPLASPSLPPCLRLAAIYTDGSFCKHLCQTWTPFCKAVNLENGNHGRESLLLL